MKNAIIVTALSLGLAVNAHAAGRDTINVVGSSTVYPFATVVAEKFGKKTSFAMSSAGYIAAPCYRSGHGILVVTELSHFAFL